MYLKYINSSMGGLAFSYYISKEELLIQRNQERQKKNQNLERAKK